MLCDGFEAGKIRYEGHWKGWAQEIKTFMGPEMATREAQKVLLLLLLPLFSFLIASLPFLRMPPFVFLSLPFIFYSSYPSLSSSLYILCMYRLFLLEGLIYLSPESVVWQWTWKTLWIFQPYIPVKEIAFFTEGREQDRSILWHSGIWRAADEAVLNIVHKEKKLKKISL